MLATVSIGTLRAQESAKASGLRVVEKDETLSIMAGDKAILVYNKVSPPAPVGVKKVYERSGFMHPVQTPKGKTVTTAFPADHYHQHGIFAAWVKTKTADQSVDFWNLAGETGRVLHERVTRVFADESKAGFEVDLLHRVVVTEPDVDVIREHWIVTAHKTAGDYFCFDLETVQTGLPGKSVLVEEYHYGGVAVRGPMTWLTEKDSYIKANKDKLAIEKMLMTNAEQQEREAANHGHTRWVTMSGSIDGQPASITMLSHSSNFRAPQAARLHPSKPYFVFSPCVDGEFTIDEQHPYKAKYRFLVTDSAPKPEWLNEQWNLWVKP